jgi:hypothetical protein
MDKQSIQAKIDLLLSLASRITSDSDVILMAALVSEVFSGTVNLVEIVWGHNSAQMNNLIEKRKRIEHRDSSIPSYGDCMLCQEAVGVLKNLKNDLNSGLLGSLKNQYSGEILSDFVVLAREAASGKEDGAKNVSAVLAASAFEDTIRRLGSEYAGIVDRPKLLNVIIELKAKEILQGSQFNIAQSMLNFRNNAMHADWDKIEKSSIEAVLGFVEQLLLKHFG